MRISDWSSGVCSSVLRNEIPLRVARQRRFAEMRISRKIVPGAGMQIGEIAATAAAHQDLLADAIGAFDHQHAPPPPAGGRCTPPTGRPAPTHDHVKMPTD